MTKEKLYSLIDTVNNQNYEALYEVIWEFLETIQNSEDIVYDEELTLINVAKKQIENNEYIDAEDFDW